MFSIVATTRNSSTTHRKPQKYAGKMNSHVVLIMRSSMFNRSGSPQSSYLKVPIIILTYGRIK